VGADVGGGEIRSRSQTSLMVSHCSVVGVGVSSWCGVLGSIGGTPETGACSVRGMGAVQRVLCGQCRVRNRRSAPVAQWIEQRFPKPQVASSSLAGSTNVCGQKTCVGAFL